MKVRVTKASVNPQVWYNANVGQVYGVLDTLYEETAYQVHEITREDENSYIQFRDCELVAELSEAPPLGIKPAKLVAEERIIEIAEAIVRYTEGGLEIPESWVEEMQDQIAIREVYKV